MSNAVWGFVEGGHITPSASLPDGSLVEIRLCEATEVPPELAEELAAWQRAGANALELVECLAQKDEQHESR
jgi:hypothetical protein